MPLSPQEAQEKHDLKIAPDKEQARKVMEQIDLELISMPTGTNWFNHKEPLLTKQTVDYVAQQYKAVGWNVTQGRTGITITKCDGDANDHYYGHCSCGKKTQESKIQYKLAGTMTARINNELQGKDECKYVYDIRCPCNPETFEHVAKGFRDFGFKVVVSGEVHSPTITVTRSGVTNMGAESPNCPCGPGGCRDPNGH